MPAEPQSEAAIREFAVNWYTALDRHQPLGQVLAYVDPALEFVVPEDTFVGHQGFARWYDAVTHRFFDEVHTVHKVEPQFHSDASATVRVMVNWQAKIWNPPAERSQWLGFFATQTWLLMPGPSGPRIRRYVVDSLDPMPGSAEL